MLDEQFPMSSKCRRNWNELTSAQKKALEFFFIVVMMCPSFITEIDSESIIVEKGVAHFHTIYVGDLYFTIAEVWNGKVALVDFSPIDPEIDELMAEFDRLLFKC